MFKLPFSGTQSASVEGRLTAVMAGNASFLQTIER
ncbi:hypothetical protein GGR40_001361 [Novosphingobium gossypii]